MTGTGKRIAIVCEVCGSDDVSRDALGAWNVATQQWEVRGVLDDAYCNRCDAKRRLVDVKLAPAH